jgi:hypothetical protein
MRAIQSGKGHRVDTANATLVYYNIVVVFSELKFGPVLSELARKLLHGHPSPLITEIPNQVLAVVYPDRQIQCEFANRRVKVTDNRGTEPGAEGFAQVVVNATNAVTHASGAEIVAYGYNYELHIPVGDQDAGAFLRARFLRQHNEIGQAFGGSVEGVLIGASVSLGHDCQANFEIQPIPERPGYAKAHVNYHYDKKSPPLELETLGAEARQKCDEFRAALERL